MLYVLGVFNKTPLVISQPVLCCMLSYIKLTTISHLLFSYSLRTMFVVFSSPLYHYGRRSKVSPRAEFLVASISKPTLGKRMRYIELDSVGFDG